MGGRALHRGLACAALFDKEMVVNLHMRGPDQALRRQLVVGGAAALALGPWATVARAASRLDARGRYRLAADFAAPLSKVVQVPFDTVDFQAGSDFSLQPGGKVLIRTTGLYEITLSIDWDLKAGRDIALRQTGIKHQRLGQPDLPLDLHARVLFGDLPGSAAPVTARHQLPWGPFDLGPGASVYIDVQVSPAGSVRPGDVAQAAHDQVRAGAIDDGALAALVMHAKVIDADTVRVTAYNPGVAAGIQVPAGTLNVLAMSTRRAVGQSGDGWHPLHSPSVVLEAGDQVYGTVKHHVEGSLVQATKMSFLQVDRLE
jgi:hypothetical protein